MNATLYSLLKLLQGRYSLWRIIIKLKAWKKCYTFALLKAIELEGIKNHIFNMMGKLCCSLTHLGITFLIPYDFVDDYFET